MMMMQRAAVLAARRNPAPMQRRIGRSYHGSLSMLQAFPRSSFDFLDPMKRTSDGKRTVQRKKAVKSNGSALSRNQRPRGQSSFDLPDPSKRMSYSDCMTYGPLDRTSRVSKDAASVTEVAAATPSAPSGYPSAGVKMMQSSAFSTATNEQSQDNNNGVRKWSPQLTKIVATIGPTSEQLDVMQDVVRCGMRVMRLNFSHATVEEVELRVKNLKLSPGRHKAANKNLDDIEEQNVRAVLLDTRGPEIRTGKLRNDESGHETIKLQQGNSITLHTTPQWKEEGSLDTDLYIDYASLHKSLKPGMKVLLDDGAVILTVESVESDKDHGDVVCTIDNTGELRSRAGVNLPGAETDLPAMSEKDKVDIKYGMTKDIDYVAASFIQNAEGVHEIRQYIEDCAKELNWDPEYPRPLIISKIESVSALNNFDDILEASDGIMVARGDLGVEIPIQQVTNAQKEMVAACNAAGKPVIVATQMLESMAKNPRPTRAEVADVTNAVYDGADAVMLSGETAKGNYPVEAVKMMNEIIFSAEHYSVSGGLGSPPVRQEFVGDNTTETAVAKAAVTAAEERGAAAILVLTNQGLLPRLVSAYRPNVPIVTFCPTAKVARTVILHRGVHPVVGLNGVDPAKRPAVAVYDAKVMGFVETGDDVIVVTKEDNDELGTFATMKVATIP